MPLTNSEIRHKCVSHLKLGAVALGNVTCLALYLLIWPVTDKAIAQSSIPSELFETREQAERKPASRAPAQAGAAKATTLIPPLPPHRPDRPLAQDIPSDTPTENAAGAPDKTEHKPNGAEHKPGETQDQSPLGTAYRPLQADKFMPFSTPDTLQLKPIASQPSAAQRPSPTGEGDKATQTQTPNDPPKVSEQQAKQPQSSSSSTAEPPTPSVATTSNVPLPPPSPNRSDKRDNSQAESVGGKPQLVPPPPSVSAEAHSATPSPASTLTERQIVERANRFFNVTETMQANFAQIGGDGKRMTGTFYLERPGRLRFAYNPPSTLEIISDGKNVAIRDNKLNTSDVYSINQTPLKFLLRDPINLASDLKIVEIARDPTHVQITVEDANTLGGTSSITLYFDPQVQNLVRWQILDAQGFVTTVILSQVQRTRRAG